MLRGITLENFKGVSKSVRVEFRPITLLFGPNSAGKSTFLHALLYLREILGTYNTDPDRTETGGDAVDLGGFKNLVHLHDLSRGIRISVQFDRDPRTLASGEVSEVMEIKQRPGGCAFSPGHYWQVDLELAWQPLQGFSTVTEVAVGTNMGKLATISAPVDTKKCVIADLNFEHPLLRTADDDDRVKEWVEQRENGITAEEFPFLSLEQALSEVFGAPRDIPVKGRVGALPFLGEDLTFVEDSIYLEVWENEKRLSLAEAWPKDALSYSETRELLTNAIIEPLRELRRELSDLLYLGPLREIPGRHFHSPKTKNAGRWATGLGAWDYIQGSSGEVVSEANKWLRDPDRLNTGYSLQVKSFRELADDNPLALSIANGSLYDDFDDVLSEFRKLKERRELVLVDQQTNTELLPKDVGTGVSQVLPVVIATLQDDYGLLAIEQPELHIHPAMQVVLGDLFIEAIRAHPVVSEIAAGRGGNAAAAGRKHLIIETHSEHLMLRLLRRIRETSDGSLLPGHCGLSVSDICVIYVGHDNGQLRVQNLRVSPDGDFEDQWPQGFFEERAEELF